LFSTITMFRRTAITTVSAVNIFSNLIIVAEIRFCGRITPTSQTGVSRPSGCCY
jgi:hypothetical protein